ncbi:MAG: formylglycine-generating enzyme family protein [Gemmatimonadaceae bacterium]
MITLAALALIIQTAVPMVVIPAGHYQPLYGHRGDAPTPVQAFRMDRDPVTRGAFSNFVRKYPEWRRSQVRPLFAERSGYLSDWSDDLDTGDTNPERAVSGLSWYAARAYCSARGARLPSVAEWEYAASASRTERYAARDAGFVQLILSLYATRTASHRIVSAGEENAYGLRGMHGIGWEWVDDFNSVLLSSDSRNVGELDHNLFCASAAIGAVDPTNYPAFLRYAMRAGLSGRSTLETFGFRCAS